MKKLISVLFCVSLIFATTTAVFADVNHFDDGHKTKEFADQGISLEIPEKWSHMQVNGTWALYPDKDVLFTLSFFEYGEGELNDALADIFLTKATDEFLTELTGVDQKGKADIFELSNGNRVASASYGDSENIYTMASTVCGPQIVIIGFQAANDKYTDEYIEDIDSILSSAKEI